MTAVELLALARGPLFEIALVIFAAGVVIRLVEILMLRRKADLSEARKLAAAQGLRTVFSRTLPAEGMFTRTPFIVIAGYIFHIGLLITIFLFIPHIESVKSLIGFGWPGLPTPLVDFVTVATLVAMAGLLINRISDPVLRFLSTPQDYLVWLVSFLPLLTGYLAFHHMLVRYELMLALHILSVELLLVVFPFTKLMHTFTLVLARWYTGTTLGRKGVAS